jgi:SAM-dependent methyltransferase
MNTVISNLNNDHLLELLCQNCSLSIKGEVNSYVADHLERFRKVLGSVPIDDGRGRLLEIGSITNTVPIYLESLNYGFVASHGHYPNEWLCENLLRPAMENGRLQTDYFDLDTGSWPYDNDSFDCVVCSEILEHLAIDPMNMMSEINRVLKVGGTLILSTPNVASLNALRSILIGGHPFMWSPYSGSGTDRHNREYTCFEARRLVKAAGFNIQSFYTFSRTPPSMSMRLLGYWCSAPWQLQRRAYLRPDTWGEFTLIKGVKNGPILERYPKWLYYGDHSETAS